MKEMIRMKNNQAIALAEVPLLTFDSFLKQLEKLMENEADVLACFVSNQPTNPPPEELELITLIGCPTTKDIAVLRCSLARTYESLTCRWPQFHLFEREIAEQYGVTPQGHPWLKPVRFHAVWQGKTDVWDRDPRKHPAVGDMKYFQVEGDEIHEVGVGPVHAGIIEPGHFRFQCFGEKVLHLEVSLGFQHRGAECLFIGGPHPTTAYQMEALAGDTSVGHMLAYSQVLESLCGLKVNTPVRDIRLIALELERLANHVGDIGAMALDIGYLPTASYNGRLRGDYLNMTAHICGSRFGRGLIRPGGSIFSVDEELRNTLQTSLELVAKDTTGAIDLFFAAPSVLSRLESTAQAKMEDAINLGVTGVPGRAYGLDTDSRRIYPAGNSTGSEYPLLCGEDGDVFARALVRRLEIKASTDFIRKKLPALSFEEATPAATSLEPKPKMLALSLVEGWRGRIAHVALTDDQGKLGRYKVIDPSFFNWSVLALAMRDEQISDFPICNKSFNLSYCGFDL